MEITTNATVLKVEDFVSKQGQTFCKISLFLDDDGSTPVFFLSGESIALANAFRGVKLAKVSATINFYFSTKGEWRANLLNLEYSKK